MKIYGIRNGHKKGLPALVRDAEAEGFVLITSNGKPVAMLTPLSFIGIRKTVKQLSDVFNSDEFQSVELDEIEREFVVSVKKSLELTWQTMTSQDTIF